MSAAIHNRPIGKPRSHVVSDARMLLSAEVSRAQRLLSSESERRHKEDVMCEAFCMPADVLSGILEAMAPGLSPAQHDEAYEKAKAYLESSGWKVYGKWGPANPAYIRSREPLRKLSELLDSRLGHSRMSLSALLEAVDDLHDNMTANDKLSYYNRIPAPVLAYSLPGNGGAA